MFFGNGGLKLSRFQKAKKEFIDYLQNSEKKMGSKVILVLSPRSLERSENKQSFSFIVN